MPLLDPAMTHLRNRFNYNAAIGRPKHKLSDEVN